MSVSILVCIIWLCCVGLAISFFVYLNLKDSKDLKLTWEIEKNLEESRRILDEAEELSKRCKNEVNDYEERIHNLMGQIKCLNNYSKALEDFIQSIFKYLSADLQEVAINIFKYGNSKCKK